MDYNRDLHDVLKILSHMAPSIIVVDGKHLHAWESHTPVVGLQEAKGSVDPDDGSERAVLRAYYIQRFAKVTGWEQNSVGKPASCVIVEGFDAQAQD